MSNYWAERISKNQDAISRKNIKQIEKQMKKYYNSAMERTIADFERVYNKILASQAEGREITPADLYKLDAYWEMQGQLKRELQKLGDRQISALSAIFEMNFFEVYYSIAIPSHEAFSTISKEAAKQLINQIWVADGKSFSQRVWGNTEKLADTLNEQLVHCVVTGKKTTELKNLLQDRFNVSYNNADMIARTEIAHIQTQAAQQRYKDYGITKVEVWVDEDERTCPICASHEGEKHPVNGPMPVPFHPRCRCCMIPVINNESENDIMNNEDKLNKIKEYYPDELKYNRSVLVEDFEKKLKNVQVLSSLTNDKHWLDQEAKLKAQIENNNKLAEDRTINSFIFCVDCGKPIHLDGRATNAVKRCPECQAIYRKKYKAEKERERRKKKKN